MTDIPSGYTPGPWKAEGPDWAGDYNITPPHEEAVVAAVISNVRPASEVEANARLIAIAPEMADEIVRLRALNAELLEASRKFVVAQDGEGDDDILNMLNYGEAVDALRALIAKAEGRT